MGGSHPRASQCLDGPRRISGLVGYQACTDSVMRSASRCPIRRHLGGQRQANRAGCMRAEGSPFSQVIKSPVRLTWFENEVGSSAAPGKHTESGQGSQSGQEWTGDPQPTAADLSHLSHPPRSHL